GVGHEAVDLPADQQLDALAVLHGVDAPVGEGPVEVAGEGVEGLVVVVVGVDRSQLHGRASYLSSGSKKNACALPYSQASRTSAGRSSACASPRQRAIVRTGWSVAKMMRSLPRVRM